MRNIINKFKLYFITNESTIMYAYSFLFGMLGALTIFIIAHNLEKNTPKIGTVNVTAIVNKFIKQETEKNLQPEVLKNEVKQFGTNLNKKLQLFSKKNNIILMLSEAVISNTHDYTSVIYRQMQLDKTE